MRTFFHPFTLSLLLLTLGCSQSDKENYPFSNLRPEVGYVGSQRCAGCHPNIFETYLQSEMGRSMSVLDSTNVVEQFPQEAPVYDPAKDYYYEMIENDGVFSQREFRLDSDGAVIHERIVEADYVIGSGNNLRMYFDEVNGMLYELPLTWYVHEAAWDLSPGYRDFENHRFSRFAGGKCISCHNSYLKESPEARSRYVKPFDLGIGCERCHGPGELHIREEMGELEREGIPSIVNPAKLPPQERLDVCQQCHLMGKAWVLAEMDDWFGYRPGRKLETHRSVYFPGETLKEVIEVGDSPQRLSMSRCFLESDGELSCLTCHDPHYSIKTFSTDHYNGKCLQCHDPRGLPGPGSKQEHLAADNCISCHMNKTGRDNTLHGVSNTDHWIRVDASSSVIDWSLVKGRSKAITTLEPFIDRAGEEHQSRLGMAYLYYFLEHHQSPAYLDSALYYLTMVQTPREVQEYFRVAEARKHLGDNFGAVSSLKQALDTSPDPDRIFYELGRNYSALGMVDSAIFHYMSAVNLRPGDPDYLEGLGVALAEAGRWEESGNVLRRALEIDKRSYLTYYHLGNIAAMNLSKPDLALSYFRESIRLEPDARKTWINLGNTLVLLEDYEKAMDQYREVVRRWPETPEAWVNIGRVYTLQGKVDDARSAFEKALLLFPDLQVARDLLTQLEADQ